MSKILFRGIKLNPKKIVKIGAHINGDWRPSVYADMADGHRHTWNTLIDESPVDLIKELKYWASGAIKGFKRYESIFQDPNGIYNQTTGEWKPRSIPNSISLVDFYAQRQGRLPRNGLNAAKNIDYLPIIETLTNDEKITGDALKLYQTLLFKKIFVFQISTIYELFPAAENATIYLPQGYIGNLVHSGYLKQPDPDEFDHNYYLLDHKGQKLE